MRELVNLLSRGPSLRTPDALVLFVTGRCNARCKHCFYAEHLNKKDDGLDRTTIARIVRSLTRRAKITLTGGEPFVLADLPDILEDMSASPNVQSVAIMSNGFLPDRLEAAMTRILPRTRMPVRIQLSLDGPKAMHDEIRKVPNGFDKTLRSAELLKSLRRFAPNLSYVLSITVMKDNIGDVEALIEDLESRGLSSKIALVRGNSFSTFGVPTELVDSTYDTLDMEPASIAEINALISRLDERHPGYISAFTRRKLQAELFTLDTHTRDLPCYAGTHDGVIYHDGTVGICEQVVPFGHLAEWDWDLSRAWNSEKATAHRQKLTTCACIHGCNLSTSVALNMQPALIRTGREVAHAILPPRATHAVAMLAQPLLRSLEFFDRKAHR